MATELELTAMFEEAKLLGPTERSIVVQTREGTNITNEVR